MASINSRQIHDRSIHSSSRNVYQKLQARIVPVVSPTTTRVRAARRVQPVTKRHVKRQGVSAARISAALQQLRQTVDQEAANIRQYAAQGSSPQTIASQVQGPLQNILQAANQALQDVKNSEYAPAPSGAFDTPPVTSSICQILLAILQCLKDILTTLQAVMQPSDLHKYLGDIMTQITGVFSQILSAADSIVPGTLKDLAQDGRDLFNSIRFDGFGFGNIMNVVSPS